MPSKYAWMKKLLCSQENYEEKETNRKPIQYIVVRRYVEQQHHTSECSNILSSKPIAVELLGAVFCDNPSTCGQKEKKIMVKINPACKPHETKTDQN